MVFGKKSKSSPESRNEETFADSDVEEKVLDEGNGNDDDGVVLDIEMVGDEPPVVSNKHEKMDKSIGNEKTCGTAKENSTRIGENSGTANKLYI